jgi:DNA-binding MarR family transcriptional regulator
LPASKYLPHHLGVPTPHPAIPATATTAAALDAEAVGRLRIVLGRLQRLLRATPAASAAGLTPTKSAVMFAVVRRGPVGLSELAEEQGLNPTMLSRTVGSLVEAGLLERTSDPSDRRAALVSATADGRRLIERVRRERDRALGAALEPLDSAQREALQNALPALEALAEELKR